MSADASKVAVAKIPTVFDDPSPELSKTYADALLGAAATPDQIEATLSELEEFISDVWEAEPRLAALLSADSFPSKEKDRILVRTLEGKASPIVLNFLRVLNRHGRLGFLPPIVRQARTIWDRKQNRRPVRVRSAVPLDEASQSALSDRLKQLIQATPILHLEVDPTLIGGLIIQVGDDVYDASVRTRLAKLRDRLIESQTHEIQSRRDHFSHSA
jgi:F-type H+-transporting ATPase subunit delta